MKRTLSSIFLAVALVAVAGLAYLSLSGASMAAMPGAAPVLQDGGDVQAEAAMAPDAILATEKFNAVAIPLDVQANWASEGYAFNAQGLAEYTGLTSVSQVLHLNAGLQSYDSWFPASGFGFVNGGFTTTPFSLEVGGAYRIILNSTDPFLDILSLVGDVPVAGSIHNTLVGASPSCKFNDIMVPLDQPTVTNANELATAMGGASNIDQILRLNATLQGYDSWFPSSGFGFVNGGFTTTPFPVSIGYPYGICVTASGNGLIWP